MKILVISYYFSPMNEVAAIRMTKIVKYLTELGHEVTVISAKNSPDMKEDTLLELDINNNTKVFRVEEYKYVTKVNNFLNKIGTRNYSSQKNENSNRNKEVNFTNIIKISIKKLLIDFYNLSVSYLWFVKSKKVILKDVNISEFDGVISSAGPISSHFVADFVKRKSNKIIWISDFRDPLDGLLINSKFVKLLVTKLQENFIKSSDAVTCVSKGLKTYVQNKHADNLKFHTIYNGFDEYDRKHLQDENYRVDNSNLNFVYCGSMYGHRRDMSVFFEAISNLHKKNKIDINKVTLHYAGNSSEIVKQIASNYNLESIVIDYGRVTREQSLGLQKKCDIILVVTWNNLEKSSQGVIPAKFYESFLVERQVLLIVKGVVKNSELSQMVNENDAGFVYEEISDDVSILENHIERKFIEKINYGSVFYEVKDSSYSQYSYKYIGKKFEKIFASHLN